MLKSLQHLSLDTEDLSDQLLGGLSEGGRVKLASLSLSMFRHEEGVRLVQDRTWRLLHERYILFFFRAKDCRLYHHWKYEWQFVLVV